MPQSNPINFDGSAPAGGTSFGGNWFAAYKHLFGPSRVEVMTYKNRKFLQTIKRVDDFEGDVYAHTLAIETPQVGSNNFTQSQLNQKKTTITKRMMINRGHDYASLYLDREEMLASRSDKGSLLRKKATETQGVIDTVSNSLNVACFLGGSGIRASFTTATGTVSGTTLNLDVPAMSIRFAVGMALQIASNNPTDGTAATLAGSGLVANIVAIRRSSGAGLTPTTLTLDTDLGAYGLSGGVQYYLLRAGDGTGFGQNVLGGNMSGLKSWLPAPVASGNRLDPVLDNMWGLNRTTDEVRLAGCTYVARSGESYSASLQHAGEELYVNGGGAEAGDMLLMVSPHDFTGVSLELGPNQKYVDVMDGRGKFGFSALGVNTQAGDWALMAEPQVEPGQFWVLDKSSYYLKTLDAVPHLVNDDGLTSLRTANSPGIEIRWAAYPQLIFDCPGKNLRGMFST